MEERTAFSAEELGAMWKNPVVSPMLAKLVLICARGGAESRDLANAHGNRDESIKAENLACNVKIDLKKTVWPGKSVLPIRMTYMSGIAGMHGRSAYLRKKSSSRSSRCFGSCI